LIVGKIIEIINNEQIKIKIYNRTEKKNQFIYDLPSEEISTIIDKKLIFKIGFQLTQRKTISSRIRNSLSSYEF
jgi:hypothetical protein